jgi:hypothetical protein
MEWKDLNPIDPYKYCYFFGYREQYLVPESKANQLKEWK